MDICIHKKRKYYEASLSFLLVSGKDTQKFKTIWIVNGDNIDNNVKKIECLKLLFNDGLKELFSKLKINILDKKIFTEKRELKDLRHDWYIK